MFKPQSDFILIKPIERKLSSALEVVVENPEFSRGLVVAIGPGERMKKKNGYETGYIRPVGVEVGDFITYGMDWMYPSYDESGIKFRIIQDKDVIFVSDRESIDPDHDLSDTEIDSLIAMHNEDIRHAA